jgi:hypothetical protein
MARPPRRPHRESPMMHRRTRLHLHSPQPPPHIHDQVVFLVIAIRLRHHKSANRRRHHKLHLRQVPPILAVPPSPGFSPSRIPFPHWFVPFSRTSALCGDSRPRLSAAQSAAGFCLRQPKSAPKQKWRSARIRARATSFSLYIQNTKSKGAIWTFSQLYIPPRIIGLSQIPPQKGLDKISPKSSQTSKSHPGAPSLSRSLRQGGDFDRTPCEPEAISKSPSSAPSRYPASSATPAATSTAAIHLRRSTSS